MAATSTAVKSSCHSLRPASVESASTAGRSSDMRFTAAAGRQKGSRNKRCGRRGERVVRISRFIIRRSCVQILRLIYEILAVRDLFPRIYYRKNDIPESVRAKILNASAGSGKDLPAGLQICPRRDRPPRSLPPQPLRKRLRRQPCILKEIHISGAASSPEICAAKRDRRPERGRPPRCSRSCTTIRTSPC